MKATDTFLDDIRIASPCTADWEKMAGNERARFCSECSKNVYNISAMSRSEAAALIASNEGNLCIRMYKRADGTLISDDCPVGLRGVAYRMSKRVRRISAMVAGVFAGLVGISGTASAQGGIEMGDYAEPVREKPALDTTTKRQTPIVDRAERPEQPIRMMQGGISAPRRPERRVEEERRLGEERAIDHVSPEQLVTSISIIASNEITVIELSQPSRPVVAPISEPALPLVTEPVTEPVVEPRPEPHPEVEGPVIR